MGNQNMRTGFFSGQVWTYLMFCFFFFLRHLLFFLFLPLSLVLRSGAERCPGHLPNTEGTAAQEFGNDTAAVFNPTTDALFPFFWSEMIILRLVRLFFLEVRATWTAPRLLFYIQGPPTARNGEEFPTEMLSFLACLTNT